MKQEKLYSLIMAMVEDLDDEYKEKLIKTLVTKKENVSELLVYVTSAHLPTVGEMISARVGMKFKEVQSHIEHNWPSFAANPDYKAVMANMQTAIVNHAQFAAAPPLYKNGTKPWR